MTMENTLVNDKANSKKSYHHGDLFRAMLSASLEVIENEGLESLSLRALAKRCGVSQTAPYRHFASKEHLLAVLAETGCQQLNAYMQQAVQQGKTPLGKLQLVLECYLNYALEHRASFQLMFNARYLKRDRYPALQKSLAKNHHIIEELLRAAGTEDALVAKNQTALLYGAVHGLATLAINDQWSFTPAHSVKEQVVNCLSLVKLNTLVKEVA